MRWIAWIVFISYWGDAMNINLNWLDLAALVAFAAFILWRMPT